MLRAAIASRVPAAVLLLVGTALPAAQFIPLNEKTYAGMLESHRGKVVLVDFWATWCDPCREELPKLVALARKVNSRRFELLTVSADEAEQEATAGSFLDRVGVGAPRYIKHTEDDQVFIDSIDPNWSGALPALFLYDASGARIRSFIGESDIAEVEAAIRKSLR